MGYLDKAGLQRLWEKTRALVGIPTKRALTLAEYNALSEEEKMADAAYIITDDNGGVVESFRGRSGAVEPEAGDYSLEQISGLEAALSGKQNALSGVPGQVVGFNAEGKPEAQEAPSGGLQVKEFVLTNENAAGSSIRFNYEDEGLYPMFVVPGASSEEYVWGGNVTFTFDAEIYGRPPTEVRYLSIHVKTPPAYSATIYIFCRKKES